MDFVFPSSINHPVCLATMHAYGMYVIFKPKKFVNNSLTKSVAKIIHDHDREGP